MEATAKEATRGRGMAQLRAAGVSLALALTFAGCGDTNPLNPDPTPTPTPAPPSKANVTLTLGAINLDTVGVPGFIHALVSNVHLNETGGVAATIDFIRLDVYLPNNTLLERTQIPSAQLPGGAALAANGVRDFAALPLGFNSDILTGRYVIVSVATTDARGNAQVTSSGQLIFG
jgi:hypothetical protein